MIDVEPIIEGAFARLYPEPLAAADWRNVLARAGERRRRRTALLVAIAAALALLAAGAAIARSLWSFPAWLTGAPGKPASQAAQNAFERDNARSWTAFPRGTHLRDLIETTKDGVHYTLFGFRTGDALCLRLVVTGAAHGKTGTCAPLSDLRSRLQPALVIAVDDGFGTIPGRRVRIGVDTYSVARASASFGIATDAVRAVTLRSDDGTRRAIVEHNAFLSVESRPRTGSRVRHITATIVGGRSYDLPFATAAFDTAPGTAPQGSLHGPAHIERRVSGGTIGWLDTRSRPGAPLPAGFPSELHGVTAHRILGRLLKPDPAAAYAVAVSLYRVTHAAAYTFLKPGLELCYTLVVGRATGGGCGRYPFFTRGPFSFGTITLLGGDQYALIDGLASDDVASLRLFLGDGGVIDVPLRDNVFVAPVARSRYPIRLVAYDRDGKVIGMQTDAGDAGRLPAWAKPDPHSPYRLLVRVSDADGHPARLYLRRSVTGGACFAVRSAVAGATGCVPPAWEGPPLLLGFLGDTRRTAILEGRVKPGVVRVVAHTRSGRSLTLRLVRGFVLTAVPHGDPFVEVDGYDAAGRRIGQFKPKLP